MNIFCANFCIFGQKHHIHQLIQILTTSLICIQNVLHKILCKSLLSPKQVQQQFLRKDLVVVVPVCLEHDVEEQFYGKCLGLWGFRCRTPLVMTEIVRLWHLTRVVSLDKVLFWDFGWLGLFVLGGLFRVDETGQVGLVCQEEGVFFLFADRFDDGGLFRSFWMLWPLRKFLINHHSFL